MTEARPEPRIYYQDDRVTLWCGDMRDVLPVLGEQGRRFDACVTDPPYEETSLRWDRWPQGWPALAAEHTRSLWMFGSMRMFLTHRDDITQRYLRTWIRRNGLNGLAGLLKRLLARGPHTWTLSQDCVGEYEIDTMVWEKHSGSLPVTDRFRRVHELATHWYHGPWRDIHHEAVRVPHRGPDKSRSHGADRTKHTTGGTLGASRYVDDGYRLVRTVVKAGRQSDRIHPTEKPVEILTPLIEYSVPPGGTVLDPFAGSCSLGMAVRALNAREPDPTRHRRAVLIEADEAMCAKAVEKRLSKVDLFTA